MKESTSDIVKNLLGGHGLDVFGVCSGDDLPGEEAQFNEWLAQGFHGTMAYLENHARAKYRPDNLLPGCRSLIFTGLNYYQSRAETPDGHGLVARYAWGRDYHKVLGKRLKRIAKTLRELFPAEQFLPFCDATPLAERSFAAKAGVGFIGRNTLLIRPGMGSFFVLGGIAATLALNSADFARRDRSVIGGIGNTACPSGCTKCIDACPTGALLEPYRLDARACIAYLTIEHKGKVPAHLRGRLGAWIFGCDVCQEVCPLNRAVEETYVADFLSSNAGASVAIGEILSIKNDDEFIERFAGSPLMRAKRAGMIQNACIAAANLCLQDLRPLLRVLTEDGDSRIRHQAEWALSKL